MSDTHAEPGADEPPRPALATGRVSKARLEAFSDGVFAIAITLLVLELGVETGAGRDLLRAIADLWPSYLAFLTSFLTVGLVWIGHHAMVGAVTETDGVLLRMNLALLFAISFLPFPTKLMGQFIREEGAERVAAVFYGTWLLLITAVMAAMWRYIATRRRLLPDDIPQAAIDRFTRRLEPNLGFYAVAIGLALIAPRGAAGLFLVISVTNFIRT